eukprot:8498093-Pyramimonas_sp.AAC.1
MCVVMRQNCFLGLLLPLPRSPCLLVPSDSNVSFSPPISCHLLPFSFWARRPRGARAAARGDHAGACASGIGVAGDAARSSLR